MGKISNLKKIQIILIALIVILGIIFAVLTIQSKNKKNYSTSQTFAQIEDTMQIEDNKDSDEMVFEVEEDTEGDVVEENPEDTSWDDKDAKDTKVDIEKEKEKEKNKEKNSGNKYYIKINYSANVVTIYTKDSEGNYTVPVKAIVCSTGTATPTGGVYKMSNKYRWHQLNGGVYGQYCSRITGHILFHSVPYAKNTPDSLKYVAYDKLGTKASAGCVRLTCQDAMWIYNNCPSGTYVEFYSSGDPGPLGKPSAQKISSNEQCRNWDPTDPTSGNPWHSYVAPASTQTTPAVSAEPQKESNTKKEEKIEVKENTNSQAKENVINNNTVNNTTNTNSSKENENNNTNNNTNSNTNTATINNTSINNNTNSTIEKDIKNTTAINTNSLDEKNDSKKNETE